MGAVWCRHLYTSTHNLYSILCCTGSQCKKVTYCSSDVVILSLAQDESCRCVEYILQGPDVNSAGAVQDAVAVVDVVG